jgi:hypothetical protein
MLTVWLPVFTELGSTARSVFPLPATLKVPAAVPLVPPGPAVQLLELGVMLAVSMLVLFAPVQV